MYSRFWRIWAHPTTKRKAMIGTNSAATVCTRALFQLTNRISDGLSGTWLNPNHIGVPTAPKVAGTEFITNVRIATRTAPKPRPTSSGAAIAAGVPKPLEPSIMNGKAHPTIINWATGLGLTSLSHSSMTRSAPERCIVFESRIAPQIIDIGVKAESVPFTTVALTRLGSSREWMRTRRYTRVAAKGRATWESQDFLLVIT